MPDLRERDDDPRVRGKDILKFLVRTDKSCNFGKTRFPKFFLFLSDIREMSDNTRKAPDINQPDFF